MAPLRDEPATDRRPPEREPPQGQDLGDRLTVTGRSVPTLRTAGSLLAVHGEPRPDPVTLPLTIAIPAPQAELLATWAEARDLSFEAAAERLVAVGLLRDLLAEARLEDARLEDAFIRAVVTAEAEAEV